MGRQEDTNPRALSCLNDDGHRTSVLKAECLEVCHIVWSMGGDRGLQNQVFPMPPQHCTSQAGLMSLLRNKFFKGYLGRQETSISLCFLIREHCSAYFLSIFGLCKAKWKRKKIYAIIPTEFLTPFQVLETWDDEDLLWSQTSWFFFFPWHDQVEMIIEYNGHGKSTCFFRRKTRVTETFERQKWNGGVRDEKEYVGSNGFRF